MNLIDTLDMYAMLNDSDNLFLLLNDYPLDNRLDRNILNSTIIKELGPLRPITTDPDLYKMMLETFFNKYNLNITRLVDTMYFEYNPLNNKNITEEEYRHSIGDIDNTDEYTTNTDNTETGSTVSENQVSAYDTNTYQNRDRNTITPNTRIDNDVTHQGETTSDIESTVESRKTISGKDNDTPYQQLIQQERKLAEFNIYEWIIQRMRKELFLLIY